MERMKKEQLAKAREAQALTAPSVRSVPVYLRDAASGEPMRDQSVQLVVRKSH